jgi:[ribosomal protein S5]-alanine N-acetyltransferase
MIVIAQTERLLLRHFHLDDGSAIDRVFGDAEVMRYGRGAQTPEWVRQWLRAWQQKYEVNGYGLWAVVEYDSQTVIGYCGLSHFPDVGGQPEVEVGYRLARAYWGRGYATEAARAVRDYAFNTLKLPRLIAIVDPQNVASIHVAEKLGLRYEKDAVLPGYTHPNRVYSLARPAGA